VGRPGITGSGARLRRQRRSAPLAALCPRGATGPWPGMVIALLALLLLEESFRRRLLRPQSLLDAVAVVQAAGESGRLLIAVLRSAAAVAAAASSRSIPFALGVATAAAAAVAAAAAEGAAPLALGVAGVVVAAAAEHDVLLLALRGGRVRHPQRGCFVCFPSRCPLESLSIFPLDNVPRVAHREQSAA
jgi:hypothetical protein